MIQSEILPGWEQSYGSGQIRGSWALLSANWATIACVFRCCSTCSSTQPRLSGHANMQSSRYTVPVDKYSIQLLRSSLKSCSVFTDMSNNGSPSFYIAVSLAGFPPTQELTRRTIEPSLDPSATIKITDSPLKLTQLLLA